MTRGSHIQSPGQVTVRRRWRHLGAVFGSLLLIGAATTLVSYSVTLYRLFCRATGSGGTTQRVAANNTTVSPEIVTIRFDTSTAPDLPWRFQPDQKQVMVHLGEQTLAYFRATNLSHDTVVGHASFNVQPDVAGLYFDKIQCFCFSEESLGPGQTAEMPVLFFVDPAIQKDPDGAQVKTITLSYTFFRSRRPEGASDLGRYQQASAASDKASPERGRQLFAVRCAVCHDLERNKTGPLLGNVVDRRAGSALDYTYSPGLANAEFVWSADNLDKWLTNPKGFIAGARMPVRVPDPKDRRDLIAYLQNLRSVEQATARNQ